MSLRETIFATIEKASTPVMAVPTPELAELDGQIFVTRTSPRALANHWKDAEEYEGLDEKAAFVCLVASDKDGNRIFKQEDMMRLSINTYLMPIVERLYWAGREYNGLTEENRRAWRKNSESTAGGGLPSSSAAPSIPDTGST